MICSPLLLSGPARYINCTGMEQLMDKQSKLNLVWMDLEMTGLDPDMEVIIEISSLVTDFDLNILAEGPDLAIHQGDNILARMDDWNQKHHTASGLIERVRKSRITVAEAERQTLEFIKQYCPENTSPLCGNSIAHDRRFLSKYMGKLYDYQIGRASCRERV